MASILRAHPVRHTLIGALALVAAVFAWLVATESGLRWLLDRAVAASPGRLSVQAVRGRVLGSAGIGALDWRDAGLRVSITGLRLAWSPLGLLRGRIEVSRLAADRVALEIADEKPPRPASPSNPGGFTIASPLAVELARLEVGRLEVSAPTPVLGIGPLSGAISLRRDGVSIRDFRVVTPWGALDSIRARFGAAEPHPIELAGWFLPPQGVTPAKGLVPASLALHAGGDLSRLEAFAELRAGPGQARLDAILAPRATMPLGSARLRVDGLDLASVCPGLPAVTLGGLAELAPVGAGLGGQLKFDLAGAGKQPILHATAGYRFDEGRLSLSDLAVLQPKGGAIRGGGTLDLGQRRMLAGVSIPAVSLTLAASGIDPRAWGGPPAQGPIAGRIEVDGEQARIRLDAGVGEGRSQPWLHARASGGRDVVRVELEGFDPRAVSSDLPGARLDARLELTRVDPLRATVQVVNAEAGALDAGRLPLARASTRVAADGDRLLLDALAIELTDGGRLGGRVGLDWSNRLNVADVTMPALEASLEGSGLVPKQWLAALPAGPLTMRLGIEGRRASLRVERESSQPPALVADATLGETGVDLKLASADPAAFAPLPAAELSGTIRLDRIASPSGRLRLANAHAGALDAGLLPVHSLAGDFALQGPVIAFDALNLALPDDGRVTGRLRIDPTGRKLPGASVPIVDAELKLAGVRPRAIMSSLAAEPLDASLQADKSRIVLQVHPAAAPAGAAGRGPTRVDARLAADAITIDVHALETTDYVVAPAARLGGRVEVASLAPLRARISLSNERAAPLDAGGVPLSTVATELGWDGAVLSLEDLKLGVGAGIMSGRALVEPSRARRLAGATLPVAQARLAIDAVPLDAIHSALGPRKLAGELRLEEQALALDLKAAGAPGGAAPIPALTAKARIALRPDALLIEGLDLDDGRGKLSARGRTVLAPGLAFDFDGRLEAVDLGRWLRGESGADGRASTLTGRWQARSRPAPGAAVPGIVDARLTLAQSRWQGVSLKADIAGAVSIEPALRLNALRADIDLGGNRLRASGALGAAGDRLGIDLNLARPQAIAPALQGRLRARGAVSGPIVSPSVSLRLDGEALGFGESVRVRRLDGDLAFGADAGTSSGARALDAQPLSLNLRAEAFRTGHVVLSKLALSARGTAGRHRFGLEGSGPGQRLAFDGEGRLRAGPDGARQWVATLGRGHAQGELRFELAPGARIAIGGGNVLLERLRAEIGVGADATRVEILETRFEPGRRLSAEGSLRGLRGALAVRIADLLRARPRPPGPVPAAITRLRLDADWKLAGTGLDDLDGRISANVREQRDAAAAFDSPAQASSLSLRLTRGRLDGRFAVSLPSLVFLRRYTGDDWVVDGQLALAGTLAGSTSAPLVRGTLEGSQLSLVQRSLGWRFDRGRLRARIDGARLDVDEFVLRSGDGEVRLAGGSRLLETSRRGSAAPTSLPIEGAFSLDADHLQLPFGPGQRLVLSGRTRIEADSGGLRWQGELKADEGVIEVRSGGVPSLPADVVIVPATESAAAEGGDPAPAPDADRAPGVHVSTRVDIDLGRNLRLTGAGVEARLEGRLALRGSLPDAPRMEGVVDVRDGSFVAYGQKLAITRGAVRFNGPIDNPVLDIVAMRRNQQVEAGVSVTGTVGSPRVRLVSNPDVSDAEKLSWLVLGAPLDRAGGAAQMLALRQAAATLRGDDPSSSAGLADRLGLEYLSVRESSASGQAEVIRDSAPVGGGSQSASATSAQQEVVAIGKRLSSRLLVSYEQGLRGVWNLLRLQYEISERMSLRAQTGTESALDLLFFFRFD